MAGFFSKLVAGILVPVLNWLVEKIGAKVKAYFQRKAEEKEIEATNAAVREKIETAQTKQEREDAAKESMRNR